jgi:hypothetical protein
MTYCGTVGQATRGNMMPRRKHVLCMQANYSKIGDAHL